ncbi:MAG: ABC transporter permease, partial [Caldilineaceae bacterium]|nr:ABC transporter permease [Caldilineaceae bacterium]
MTTYSGQTTLDVRARLRELGRYKGLIHNLTLRELKTRYKNTALGFLWSLLNPLAMMIVFTAVFTVMLPNNQIEKFPIFVLCGLLPWNFFSAGVMGSINVIVSNSNLVTKVYFPREVLPISSVLANLVNFLLTMLVLFAALLIFRSNFSPWIWMLPIVILAQVAFILGLALVLSTMNVFYRDTLMVMDVVMLAWFFLTPVFYPIEILPNSYMFMGFDIDIQRLMYILNPMASIISAYRDLLYYGYRTDLDFLLRTTITCLLILAFGYWFLPNTADDLAKRYSHVHRRRQAADPVSSGFQTICPEPTGRSLPAR